MEELLNQMSVEITPDRKLRLFISKIDLDYAYGKMKLSKVVSKNKQNGWDMKLMKPE